MNQYLINEYDTEDTLTYFNGKLHGYCGGPAVIAFDGTQIWFEHGVLHRDYGPALIGPNGNLEYWYHGEQYSKEEFDKGLEFY